MDKRHDKNKNANKRMEDIKYCRALKEFLRTFKTQPCPLHEEHRTEYCTYHHSPNDRRRNPYTETGLLYYLDQQCFCDNPVLLPSPSNVPPTTPTTNIPTIPSSIKHLPAHVTPAMLPKTSAGCSTRANPPSSSRESSSGLISPHSKPSDAIVQVLIYRSRPAREESVPVLPQRKGQEETQFQRLQSYPLQ